MNTVYLLNVQGTAPHYRDTWTPYRDLVNASHTLKTFRAMIERLGDATNWTAHLYVMDTEGLTVTVLDANG